MADKTKSHKIGQITVKRIGKKYAACISETPEELFDTFMRAKKGVEKLRLKYGRRIYGSNLKYRCKNKR